MARSPLLILALLLLPTAWPPALAAQRLPPARFDARIRATVVRPVRALPGPPALPAVSSRWRDNHATVLAGAVLGAGAGLAAGGVLGAVVGAPTGSGCGDYPCWFVYGVYVAMIGEPFGAGYGGYLGGRRHGSAVLDMLAATGAAAIGLVPMVRGDVAWYVVPAGQLISIVLVDRAAAAVRDHRNRGAPPQDPFR